MNHWTLRLTAIVALFVATGLFAIGCDGATGRGSVDTDKPLKIIATIKPIELIVRDLIDPSLDDLVEVSLLMTPDVSPHGFEPTPSQMARLRSADVVIYNGLGLDDWAVRDLPRGTLTIAFADVLGEELDHHHHHHHDHDHSECDHDHGPIDEHLWLDVELTNAFAAKCAAEIGRRLSDAGTGDAHAVLQASLSRFIEAALEIDREYAHALSEHQGRRIVTHHNVFSRVAERYGLGDPIVLRPVEMLEPTPGDIRRAIEAVRADSLKFIFIEPQFSPAAAERIRDETGVKLILVDPLGSEATSWGDMMRTMRDALATGLGHSD